MNITTGIGYAPQLKGPRVLPSNNGVVTADANQAKPARAISFLRFASQTLQQTGKNGLWVTVELSPYVVKGGLGQVSKTIPEALNQYLGKDVRILMPMWKQLKELGGFENTGVSVRLKDPLGKWETFTLMQKTDRPGQPVIYAIANETYFGRHDVPYLPANEDIPGIGKDAEFRSIMTFNRAAGRLIPYLDSSAKQPKQSKIKPFDGDLEFIIVNDWLTSPTLSEMPKMHRFKLGDIFDLHNTFNHPRPKEYAHQTVRLKPAAVNNKTHYSPLQVGIALSDAVIANRHYADRIIKGLYGNPDYSQELRLKQEQGKVFDMHHGLSGEYSAINTPYLREDGYTELASNFFQLKSKEQMAEMARFKRINKSALQKELGLKQDEQAVIYAWVARPDPYQKGFQLVADTLKAFLQEHPNTQAVIAGLNDKNPSAVQQQFVQTIQGEPELNGRVAVLNFVKAKTVTRINAGSDFLMLPSLYEPYGLSQLEAMILGSVPIVHGVDGLLSTVSDPRLNKKVGKNDGEIVWSYGQTGIIMKPIQVLPYWQALDKRYRGEKLDEQAMQLIKSSSNNFRQALERSVKLVRCPSQLTKARINGMRFVVSEHSWEKIAARYEKPIQAALTAAAKRRNQAQTQS